MKIIIKILFFLFFSIILSAQSSHKLRLEADKHYDNGEIDKAEINYKKALEKDEEYKAHYNRGNALFNQQRYEEASEAYQKALSETNNNSIKAQIYHNLGNTYFNLKNLEKSIESFKESLRINPNDEDTRKNLNLVKQIKRQQEKKQQQQQQKQNKDNQNKNQDKKNQNKQDKENQNKQDKENQQKDEQQKQNKKQEQQKDEEQKKNQEQEKNDNNDQSQAGDKQDKKLTKEEIQKLLKAIEGDDENIQKRIRKNSKSRKKEKDW